MKREGATKRNRTANAPLIVVADDEDAQRIVLERSLRAEGYRVVALDDGGRIWEVLETEPAALLVLDLRMPGVNGWEVMRRLRFDRLLAVPRPRIVIVSAQTDRETRDFALSLGANAFLEKPLDLTVLAATVRRELAERLEEKPQLDRLRRARRPEPHPR